MKHHRTLIAIGLILSPIITIIISAQFVDAQRGFQAIKIVAPDAVSVPVYSQPNTASDLVNIALNNDILEVVGDRGEFLEVRVPSKNAVGFVQKQFTVPWTQAHQSSFTPLILGIGAVVLLVGIIAALILLKKKKEEENNLLVESIPAAFRNGEEMFRMGDYEGAVREFNRYIELQGGEVKNPDLYRRLTVSYKNIGEMREAIKSWEKMRDLGGLSSVDDHSLGVELKLAWGREAEAAEIYEQLLSIEPDEDKRLEVHQNLLDMYRRLKNAPMLVNHALAIKHIDPAEIAILGETADFLIAEAQTDLAIECNDKDLLRTICHEFLEDKARTPEAGRIYLKCLEYDRTDKRLHRILAMIYNEAGDYRRAVSELTILSQVDKDRAESYMDEAAKVYMETGKVGEALQEGNPGIVKKIAQMYLVRSEVNPEAVAVYEKVLEFQPKAIGINRMLSTVYMTQGNLDKYMEKLRLLHELDGANQDYLTDLAQCIIDNDLIDRAVKERNKDLNTKILKQLMKKGTTNEKAVSLLEKLSRTDPHNVNVRIALAKAYDKLDRPAEAFEQLQTVIRHKPEDQAHCARMAELAVERNLLAPVAQQTSRSLIVATAVEIMNKKVEGPEALGILETAAKLLPDDKRLCDYLSSIRGVKDIDPEIAVMEVKDISNDSLISESPFEAKPSALPQNLIDDPFASSVVDARQSGGLTTEPTPDVHIVNKQSGAKAAEPKLIKTPKSAGKNTNIAHPLENTIWEDERDSNLLIKGNKTTKRKKSGLSSPKSAKTTKQNEPAARTIQYVSMSDEATSTSKKAVTTFVTGYTKGEGLRDIHRSGLFFPSTGGLAYKEMEILVGDTWGNLHIGAEVNTARPVLLRIFRQDLLEPGMMKEFLEETAKISHSIVHNNILRLEDILKGPQGRVALAHPFYPKTLEMIMQPKLMPTFEQRIQMMMRILQGISYAHNYCGVDGKFLRSFHLHLQPRQILVDEALSPVIMGLGYSQTYRNLTRAKQPRGQDPGAFPATLPPEFFKSGRGAIKERAADIYSLGILMYFLATGEYPFEGPSFDDYKFQHTRISAVSPKLIDNTIPDWLESIILCCLEKEPEKRYDTVNEIGQSFVRNIK